MRTEFASHNDSVTIMESSHSRSGHREKGVYSQDFQSCFNQLSMKTK